MDINIKIVGLGEGGTKVINKLIEAGVDKNKAVEFITIGNDENIMLTSSARKNIFLNRDLTLIYKNIFDALNGAKLIFIVAGLASNAAKAAIPIITSYAKTYNALTVALVCKPSVLEGFLRKKNAEYTMNNLRGKVNTLFVVPAEKFFVFRINQPQISLHELFDVADEVFCQGVKILLDVWSNNSEGLEIFEWANAAFGYGEATTALEAVKLAAKFPTFEEDEFKTTKSILIRLTSENPLSFSSVAAATGFIEAQLPPDAETIFETNVVPLLGDKVFASIICKRK